MDIRRLKFVQDICPLFSPDCFPPYDATAWASKAQMTVEPIVYHQNGFTTTVLRNPLFTWRRSFSTDNKPVYGSTHTSTQIPPSKSWIQIDEWIPGFGNNIARHGYTSFGAPRRHGLAEIPVEKPVEQYWSTNAKRHLKVFQKQTDVTIRLGTLDEIEKPYSRSSVPRNMCKSMWGLTQTHFLAHPETVEVLVAESKTHGIVAAFVSGACVEASASYYLLGFYLPAAKASQAMTGLIHVWFERTRTASLKLCNFGDMCGPNSLPFDSGRGYSIFKTHFGIRRVHYPCSHWKIRLNYFHAQ